MFRKLFSRPVLAASTLAIAAGSAAWLTLGAAQGPVEAPVVVPQAGEQNTFFAPIRTSGEPAAPAIEGPSQGAGQPKPTAAAPGAGATPSWLWGLPEKDRHPKAVYEAWRAWAATQGHSEHAARELVAYAKAHPMRRSHGEEKSVDEWMDVLGRTDDAVLVQATLAQGYLAPLLAAQADGKEDAWRDLRAFMGCSLELCTSLRALHAMSDGLGRAALAWASDAASRCGIAVTGAQVTRGLALEVDAQLAARGHRDGTGYVVSPQFLAGGAGTMPCDTLAARIASGS